MHIANSAEDEPRETEGLPFLKFPKEIRIQIYKYHISHKNRGSLEICPSKTNSNCHCYSKPVPHSEYLPAALARTCKSIRNEFLECVYSEACFSFSCTCDMYFHLNTNKLLHTFLRDVKVHWCGPKADLAFSLLASCPNLRQIQIVISKATTTYLMRRQEEMLRYFPTQRLTRLCDALGMDELLKLRGMTSVNVSHILARQGSRRTDEERAGLLRLLVDKLQGSRREVAV